MALYDYSLTFHFCMQAGSSLHLQAAKFSIGFPHLVGKDHFSHSPSGYLTQAIKSLKTRLGTFYCSRALCTSAVKVVPLSLFKKHYFHVFIIDCTNMFQTEVWLLRSELQNNFCKWIKNEQTNARTHTQAYE